MSGMWAGGGNVQDSDIHAVMHHVQHLGHQDAGADGDGLPRFQIDLHAVFAAEILYQFHQPWISYPSRVM